MRNIAGDCAPPPPRLGGGGGGAAGPHGAGGPAKKGPAKKGREPDQTKGGPATPDGEGDPPSVEGEGVSPNPGGAPPGGGGGSETRVENKQPSCVASLSHEVDFIITANAGVTPTWSLVHFKGPGGGASASNGTSGGGSATSGASGSGGSNGSSGSFLFASRQEMHKLHISMAGPGRTPSAEGFYFKPGYNQRQEDELNSQRLYNLNQQLINALTPK